MQKSVSILKQKKNVFFLFQKLVFVEILAILAMAYGDVSHIVPNANEINGLSGYQYDSSEDSLQYLPPSLPQQPHAFHVIKLITN